VQFRDLPSLNFGLKWDDFVTFGLKTNLQSGGCSMDYTLNDHGDLYERRFWSTLSASFPNYEILWQQFIVPLTGRDSDGSTKLRSDIDPLLEELAMAHYSVFFHLGVSRDLHISGSEFFEDIFFHLSAATEMVEQLILSIAKLLERIKGRPVTTQIDEEEAHQHVQNYWKKSYKKDYNRFLKTGRAVSYSFHQIDKVAGSLCSYLGEQARKDYDAWSTLKNKIRHYRNTLAHNPRLGHFLDPSAELRVVPKEDKLSDFRLWSSLPDKPDPGNFINLEDLVAEYQTDLEKRTDSLWVHLLNLLSEITATDEYQSMAGGREEPPQDRLTELFATGVVDEERPIMPSGSSTSPLLEGFRSAHVTSASGVDQIEPEEREQDKPADSEQKG
jgi:hypothetical protein